MHVRIATRGGPLRNVRCSRATQRALDSAIVACGADARCRSAAPDPSRDIASLLARLREKPAELHLWNQRRHADERITLTAPMFAELLWLESYAPSSLTDLFPIVHHAVATGSLVPLTERLARDARVRRTDRHTGLMLSVICTEDMPRLSAADTMPQGTLLGAPEVAEVIAACREWPRGSVSPEFGKRVVSSIPTLLISGGRDPVTPPEVADSAAVGLSRSERYVDANAGHAALDDRSRARLAAFLGVRLGRNSPTSTVRGAAGERGSAGTYTIAMWFHTSLAALFLQAALPSQPRITASSSGANASPMLPATPSCAF